MTSTATLQPSIEIQRSGERMATRIDWLDSRHSFSFGGHYDPDNTHFGLLLVSNDDVIAPETGFSTHPHRDMEIVTWVLKGELEHKDSEGHIGLIHPGLAQRMSAGTGILHSEMNATKGGEVHLVQMWVVPDTARSSPPTLSSISTANSTAAASCLWLPGRGTTPPFPSARTAPCFGRAA